MSGKKFSLFLLIMLVLLAFVIPFEFVASGIIAIVSASLTQYFNQRTNDKLAQRLQDAALNKLEKIIDG